MWFWVLLIGALGARYVLPVIIAILRHFEDIALVVLFNVIPIGVARRAPPGPHDAAQRRPVALHIHH
jgi:hypothetical protein